MYSPITDPKEIENLLDELPLALERDRFIGYVTGFPRRYLTNTARSEIVKHYLLMENLGDRPVISSLFRQEDGWKLVVIARDRYHLFTRIAGALSCLGADIVSAEAFGNRRALVLDTFFFKDSKGRFDDPEQKDEVHRFLEEAIEGKHNLDQLLAEKLLEDPQPPFSLLELEFNEAVALGMTRLSLRAGDHFGLLYEVSHRISEAGCNIEMAYIQTVENQARDYFYLTSGGKPLTLSDQERLRETLEQLSPQPS